MKIERKYLDEFAYIGDRIYMNVSSIGLQPERTRQMSRIFLDEYSNTFGNAWFGGGSDSMYMGKKTVAALIGADPEDVFLTDNTTQGNNLVPYGYPFEAGDEVIIGNGDFVAVWLPWAGLQSRGVKVTAVNNENGVTDVDDYIAKITDRTRAIGISWVQSSSGYRADIAKLGRVCREKGIILCVDAIQGMGRLPMDVKTMNIDVLASGSFKGLLGVMGAGFCYCRPEIMEKIDPHVCSGNLASYDFPFDGFSEAPVPVLAERAARMETGTCNHYGYTMMRLSMELLMEIGMENIAARIRELEICLRDSLKKMRPGVRFLGSSDPETWSGTVSLWIDSLLDEAQAGKRAGESGNPELTGAPAGHSAASPVQELEKRIHDSLAAEGIFVTVRGGFIRIALHYFNSEEQIERVISVLQRCVNG